MPKPLRILGGAMVWAVVVASVGILLFVGIGPHTGQYRTRTVLSGSMQPDIPQGSVVIITPEPARTLSVGQVITYRIPVGDHAIVTHRVTRVVEEGDRPVFETKGDANPAPDPWLARVEGDTVWRVRHVVPAAGEGIRLMRQPLVQRFTLTVVPLLLAGYWLAGIWGGQRPDTPAVPVP